MTDEDFDAWLKHVPTTLDGGVSGTPNMRVFKADLVTYVDDLRDKLAKAEAERDRALAHEEYLVGLEEQHDRKRIRAIVHQNKAIARAEAAEAERDEAKEALKRSHGQAADWEEQLTRAEATAERRGDFLRESLDNCHDEEGNVDPDAPCSLWGHLYRELCAQVDEIKGDKPILADDGKGGS